MKKSTKKKIRKAFLAGHEHKYFTEEYIQGQFEIWFKEEYKKEKITFDMLVKYMGKKGYILIQVGTSFNSYYNEGYLGSYFSSTYAEKEGIKYVANCLGMTLKQLKEEIRKSQ